MSSHVKCYWEIRYWLCLWHISKDAHSYLKKLKANLKFQSSLNKHQIQKFNHRDHHKFNMIYKIWHKWRTVFTKDSFIVEFRASTRSESTNHVLTNIANKTKSLTNFVIKYENVFLGMHSLDFKEDFKCK